MSKPGLVAAIDVGGTGTKWNVFDSSSNTPRLTEDGKREDSQFQKQYSTAWGSTDNASNEDRIKAFLDDLVGRIEKLSRESGGLTAVGLCVPAKVDESGWIDKIPAFGISGLNLKEMLKEALNERCPGLEIEVVNDVAMHTLGVYRALKSNETSPKSLMVVSAGTATGIGIRLEGLKTPHSLISGSEFCFPASYVRGYGLRWSIEKDSTLRECPDLGWKAARKGIEDTFAERVSEVLGTTVSDEQTSFDDIMNASKSGDRLARRIVVECLDPDAPDRDDALTDADLEHEIEKRFHDAVEQVCASPLYTERLAGDSPKSKQDVLRAMKEGLAGWGPVDSKTINDYATKDELAASVLKECGQVLGRALRIAVSIVQPEYLVFAGGVARSETWLEAVKKAIVPDPSAAPKEWLDPEKWFLTLDSPRVKGNLPFKETQIPLLGAVELFYQS